MFSEVQYKKKKKKDISRFSSPWETQSFSSSNQGTAWDSCDWNTESPYNLLSSLDARGPASRDRAREQQSRWLQILKKIHKKGKDSILLPSLSFHPFLTTAAGDAAGCWGRGGNTPCRKLTGQATFFIIFFFFFFKPNCLKHLLQRD